MAAGRAAGHPRPGAGALPGGRVAGLARRQAADGPGKIVDPVEAEGQLVLAVLADKVRQGEQLFAEDLAAHLRPPLRVFPQQGQQLPYVRHGEGHAGSVSGVPGRSPLASNWYNLLSSIPPLP